MPNIVVRLEEEEARILLKTAHKERRDLKKQIIHLAMQQLEQDGVIKEQQELNDLLAEITKQQVKFEKQKNDIEKSAAEHVARMNRIYDSQRLKLTEEVLKALTEAQRLKRRQAPATEQNVDAESFYDGRISALSEISDLLVQVFNRVD